MSSSTTALTFTAGFTAALGLACGNAYLMPATVELVSLLALIACVHVWTAGMNPVDRAKQVAFVVVAGMLLVTQVMLYLRGEPRPILSGFFRTLTRFGPLGFLISWTAMVTGSYGPGRRLYNLVFVASFTLWFGHVSSSLVLGAVSEGAPGGLAAWLEGAALGSALAYVTLGAHDERPVDSPGGNLP